MRCPTCNAPNPPENLRCQQCGAELPPPHRTAADDEVEALPAGRPAPAEDAGPRRPRPPEQIDAKEGEEHERRPAPRRGRDEDEGAGVLSTIIPYKNPKALAAYYCGFFALIPGLGFLLAVAAIVLGILGLRYKSAHPEAKGTAHAIIGIILGVVGLFCWNPLVCFLLWFTYMT